MRSIFLKQIGELMKCRESFPPEEIKGFGTDSRLIKPGEIFFALQGQRTDGHDHLEEVKKKGAKAAVVSKNYERNIAGLHLIRVSEPLNALQELARHTLSHTSTKVVAITGSLGKTSTKEFTKSLLQKKYRVAASPGNSNSQVGLPLAILNHTTGDEEILVLEMGMTLPGHLARLIEIAPPEVAVMTTAALVHACNFESVDQIASTKAEIFLHPQTRLGIIPRDLSNFIEIKNRGRCSKLSFSILLNEADFYLNLENQTIFTSFDQKQASIQTPNIPGKHVLHNLLAAIVVARHFELEWNEINDQIPSLVLPERRLQFIRQRDILFLNDTQNAAEVSVKAALEILPQPEKGGRKIAVLGSMMELGEFSENAHRRVGEFALSHVEQLYCLGEECLPMVEVWQRAGKPVEFFLSRQDLTVFLKNVLRSNDVVLLKGSLSKELWKVLEEV